LTEQAEQQILFFVVAFKSRLHVVQILQNEHFIFLNIDDILTYNTYPNIGLRHYAELIFACIASSFHVFFHTLAATICGE